MVMKIDPRDIEVIDQATAAYLRTRSGPDKLRAAAGMFRFARETLLHRTRKEHPDWSEERVRQEVLRRLTHGTG